MRYLLIKSTEQLVLLIVVILLISMCCVKEHPKNDFVYIDNKQFGLNGEPYFPIMVNYVLRFRKIGDEFVLSPIKEYENPEIFETNTKDSIQHQIKGHLQVMKEMGFNSLRLCFNRINIDGSRYYYYTGDNRLYIDTDSITIINALGEFIDMASASGLRVMLLIREPIDSISEEFTVTLLKRFRNDPTIFAYDFFNEPLYFDNTHLPPEKYKRDKMDAYRLVCRWKELMVKYAPDQLFTIGFSEPIEVFEWDPSILPVDFVAFHTYHPLRIPNEIYWFSKYVDKPWMVGETSLPADGDSVTYDEQRQFMKEVYGRIIDCKGAGLGWWEFQEIPSNWFEPRYAGILNNTGYTTTKDGKYTIRGTVKPAAKEIAGFKDRKASNDCNCMVNYYNMVGYSNIVLKGRIVNKENGDPVEGAVIRGWNKWWSVGMNTFTNEDGEFTLYSNDICVHFEISAPGMSQVKFDYEAEYQQLYPTDITFETLPDQYLEYHGISYKPFLKNNIVPGQNSSEPYIFNFDEKKFNKAIFQGKMVTIGLKPLELPEKK